MRNEFSDKAWKMARRGARRLKESGRLESLTVTREDRDTGRRETATRDAMGRKR